MRAGVLKRLGGVLAAAILAWAALLNVAHPPRPAAPATAPAEPAAPGDDAQCDQPGKLDARLYGRVSEDELPWSAEMPPRLADLLAQTRSDRLVSAFRTTLPNPLFNEEYNIGLAADLLAGRVVEPGQVFSVLQAIGPFTADRGYRDGPTYIGNRIVPTIAGGVCKISSTMYNAVVFADLQVVERHPHGMPVPYVPPGRDATIAWGALDFKFRNNRDTPIVIWSDTKGYTLYIALYGSYDPPVVTWHHQELSREKAPTIRRPNPALPHGEERVIGEGLDGVTVRTWVTIQRPGQPPETKPMGVDHYRPLPRIVEYGP